MDLPVYMIEWLQQWSSRVYMRCYNVSIIAFKTMLDKGCGFQKTFKDKLPVQTLSEGGTKVCVTQ
eukprot:scaffold123979_cov18-Tisochrysis_lutea.AAC.1